MKRVLTTIFVIALLLAWATPAAAITYGTPDGNGHPFVGSMVFILPRDTGTRYYQMCSGTLIAPQVFLTASHCTIDVYDMLDQYPNSQMVITFDPTISPTSAYYTVSQWVTNPAYIEHRYGASDPGDVAVALLDEAPAGITPARLPSAGLLNQLKDEHVLNHTLFTAVGYGTVRDSNRKGPAGILDNLDRNKVDQGFLSLTDAWLTLSMNLATGNGGTCYGDSGGPHFIHLNGKETNIVVAVTVTGDAQCKATDRDYRVDTPQAREFLGKYVTLP